VTDTEHAAADGDVEENVELAVDEGVERDAGELGAVVPLPHDVLVNEPGQGAVVPVETVDVEIFVEGTGVVLVLVPFAVNNVSSGVELGVCMVARVLAKDTGALKSQSSNLQWTTADHQLGILPTASWISISPYSDIGPPTGQSIKVQMAGQV